MNKQNTPLLPTDYENMIIGWALEKGIAFPENKHKQFEKFLEEVEELTEEFENYQLCTEAEKADVLKALELEAGDVLVTLVIYLHQCGSSLPSAMQAAWEKIKNRKGKTIDGQFVKQSDLCDG